MKEDDYFGWIYATALGCLVIGFVLGWQANAHDKQKKFEVNESFVYCLESGGTLPACQNLYQLLFAVKS